MLRRFVADTTASVATVFAFSLMALMAAAGLAIDFAFAFDRRSKLDAAADAAILTTLKVARDGIADGKADWLAKARRIGEKAFRSNKTLGTDLSIRTINITIERNENEFRGSLVYDVSAPTTIMKLFNKPLVSMSNSVTAALSMVNYLDIHLLIDISTSMGIGATPADQSAIEAATGCALACHFTHAGGAAENYPAVRATGARLRIDFVRDAVRNFIDNLKSERNSGDQVRLSIDLFDNRLIPLVAPTTDLDAASAAAIGIDLTAMPNTTGTNIAYALDQLSGAIDPSGDGYAPNRRKSFVVLLSDGIENTTYAIPGAAPGVADFLIVDPNRVPTSPSTQFRPYEYVQTMEASSCSTLKSMGHTLLTAHVEYLIPAVSDARFDYIKDNLADKSISEFRACASKPDLAFMAAESDEIAPLFDQVLKAIFTPSDLRLSN